MKAILGVMVVCLSLTACEGGWTGEDKTNFINLCEENENGGPDFAAKRRQCQCRLEQTIKVYPTINAMVDNRDSIKLREAVQQCK